ncbi:hypothetical protein Acr_00g0011510 [Actinidia rufa]|uniref:Uncharacterized protein n=1 Tax=Actinidia rufa TaxID=165716 RepID=A0A7J0D9G9_9ERIC|nr:hypothetical protein Acr_00g0011510 [Actinidia rufa]
MPSYSLSESDDDRRTPIGKPFGRQRPIYDILGRGKGCLCVEMLPYLYERYEEEVDDLVERVNHRMRKSYKKFDSEFLRKIPRGLVKDKKSK